ncbi:Uncharacterized protein HZ326_23454 [Fusarium oxysporum f. sp. albedinis]|nr:Uncharacterized protein HZ326_23454 [Fusarium oxysporum f. sp. albedinis]
MFSPQYSLDNNHQISLQPICASPLLRKNLPWHRKVVPRQMMRNSNSSLLASGWSIRYHNCWKWTVGVINIFNRRLLRWPRAPRSLIHKIVTTMAS